MSTLPVPHSEQSLIWLGTPIQGGLVMTRFLLANAALAALLFSAPLSGAAAEPNPNNCGNSPSCFVGSGVPQGLDAGGGLHLEVHEDDLDWTVSGGAGRVGWGGREVFETDSFSYTCAGGGGAFRGGYHCDP
jgi:hypothetical protein